MKQLQFLQENLLEVRQQLYSGDGLGYYVFKNFLDQKSVSHVRDIWTNDEIIGLFEHFPGKDAFTRGCPNFTRAWDKPVQKGRAFYSFLWNRPVDEVTHLASFTVAYMRSEIMGQYPLEEIFGYGGQATSYRVAITEACTQWVAPHRDYLTSSDDPKLAKRNFDLSRLQATLVLSKHGEDYTGDGFIFESNSGDTLYPAQRAEPGDLLLWRYNNLHSVENIEKASGIGFMRIIFPPEMMNKPRALDPRASKSKENRPWRTSLKSRLKSRLRRLF